MTEHTLVGFPPPPIEWDERTLVDPMVFVPEDERWDDETSFRTVSGFTPAEDSWFQDPP